MLKLAGRWGEGFSFSLLMFMSKDFSVPYHFNKTLLRKSRKGKFNSDDHYIYYCGQESLRRNGIAIIVNKRVRSAVLECNLKNDRMISVRFQGKPFNITVTQVYAPCSWKSWSWMILWRPTTTFRTNTQKRCPFHYRGLECKKTLVLMWNHYSLFFYICLIFPIIKCVKRKNGFNKCSLTIRIIICYRILS